ncbi:hypothetical protein AQUCO_07200133v1 [Aquilegia coerulea]|uniref:Protein BIC1 n=1 Tax=Aquilegia coerulea TaxID=218851 RepID=A0A2G5CAG0_AQUCA|nr:hypothetical protein AQUCO_07200133v1 [Aquilegia coerulea]
MMHSNNRSNDHSVQPVKLPQISDDEVIDPSEPAKIQHSDDDDRVELQVSSPTAAENTKKIVDRVQQIMKTQQLEDDQVELARPCSSLVVKTKESTDTTLLEVSGREKLKRHRTEVAGQVWIPDIWGQEELLKDWIDCSAFDASLIPSGLMSARAALVQEAQRTSSGGCVKS